MTVVIQRLSVGKLKNTILNFLYMLFEDIQYYLFFTDDIIIYVENHKESLKSLLELKSKFSKVTGYKISIQIQMYFSMVTINYQK